MKVAIMQPYFFPYVGYFQLIASADLFVIYDNIKYTKKGWINRNRLLRDGKDFTITVPLRKDSNILDVKDRVVAADFDRRRLANQVREAYFRAPHFLQAFPVIERCILSPQENLFEYVRDSVMAVCDYLEVKTRIVSSSGIAIAADLRAEERVIALCKAVGATIYINPVGGQELYSPQEFQTHGIELKFLQSHLIEYPQFGQPFVPSLSITDVMMFNSVSKIREYVDAGYDLV